MEVKGRNGDVRREIQEMLQGWAGYCKVEGRLVHRWYHHTPLRNSYLSTEIKAILANELSGQFEMRIVHFRYFTAHVVFTASLEA
jgi:hypothetical protein